MKHYRTYRDIRRGAMIMGLPLSLFAIWMLSVIASLMVVIFSFHFSVIVVLLLFNALLYGALGQWAKMRSILRITDNFPKTISNKRLSPLSHEPYQS